MPSFMHVRAETQPDCTRVAETPGFCMGVAEMLSVFTEVTEISPDRNSMGGTPAISREETKCYNDHVRKKSLEVVGLILARLFIRFWRKRPLGS